ncbi:FAD-dependent oxidoreductase [Azohydromonas caseinilytica]|uniref:NAD(P)-binding protein n=1 Tax=Azohydromonas caseinilytica TaxID=2728836 RepID=A0A848F283_9BURK|nr:FAD-dependent oxidoreductase [Azohydromonas caseinilytica]NML13512.1 NAD(P)-binding protein [Azohydromonas caseinilytica]
MSATAPISTPTPPTDLPLQSFWIGGFEGADHLNASGRPLDMVRANGHLQRLDEDYARCAALGLRSLRESLGWRLSETAPGVFDFERARHMARCARRHGLQLLWSLMHYGTPPDVSLLDDALIPRFAAFAAAAARALADESDAPPIYTPINEISFLAWAVSASRLMHPYGQGLEGSVESTLTSGYAVKRRLVRAALAAVEAIRRVDPRARFMHIDPLVHVVPPPGRPELQPQADAVAAYQWQAWDMLAGRAEPQLGGHPDALDIVGVNHYHSGQWELLTEKRLRWHEHDPRRKPPALLLREAWQRYHRPVVMAETSHVGAGRVAWLHDMATQVQRARAEGVPVQGLCLYPLVDRPDWDTPGHWHRSGLCDVVAPAPGAEDAPDAFARLLNTEYATALRWWQTRLPVPASRLPHIQGTPDHPSHQGSAMPPSSAANLPPLVVFCHLRWGFVYQRPQHLLSRLSEHYRVLFVEEPIHLEGEPRLDRVPQGPNLEVLVPRTPVTAPGFHDDQLSLLKPLLAEFLREEGIEDCLVWFYTPMALPLIAALKPRAVVYDCMDELSAFKNAPKQLRQRETALMKMSSVVFTGGPALFEAKRHLHPNVHCLPSSVDVHHFAPQRLKADSAEAQEAKRLQSHIAEGPRLGFYGVIDERLDLELVAAIADARPDWQLVMVGPVVKIDPASLPQRANITYLGMQSYAMLPHLMAHWDLCLMPFALNESTRFISPTKTLEYMAGEKPVVSTAVRDVEQPYGDVVRIGRDQADFIQGCAEMLALSDAQRRLLVGRMQEALRKVSWDRSARTVARCLRQALRESTVDSPAALRELAGLASPGAEQSAAGATSLARAPVAAQPPSVRHLVIGAGPTGLATAYHLGLHDQGHDTLVVEREEHVGGGCRSVHQQGYTFDHGAHVLQSADPEVRALAERLLGDNLHWQPPRVQRPAHPASQEGLPPLRADRDFGYPLHGGFQALMDAFLPLLDCEIALKTTLLHLSPSRRMARLDDGRSVRYDTLVSTMPLPALVQACGDEAPAELRNAARALRQGSLRCVNLGLGLAPGRERLTEAHWIEAPAGCVFQRVFVQGNASAHNNAPGGFALSCEIAYGPHQPLPCEGAALIDRVIDDCRRIGLFGSADPVQFAAQLDLPCARALPDPAQQAALVLIRQWFAEHGIVLAGHHGRWHADGAPHAFTAGRQAAELVMTLLQQRNAQSTTALQQQTG